MTSFFTRIRFWLENRLWHCQLRITRHFLTGRRRWEALDRLGIAGHGNDLIRLDFPPDLSLPIDWSPAQALLAPLIDAQRTTQIELLKTALEHAPDFSTWPLRPLSSEDPRPWLENCFLCLQDCAVLHGLLVHLQPRRYLEIGSGISTRVAALARARCPSPFEIHSFDPEPRTEVATLCDHIHRTRLELVIEQILNLAQPGDVVFFDGSHRSFPGSDVTLFFLSLLPRLASGVIVHIHDIHLPADYPAGARFCFWSEQYLLAAWLLGGSRRIEIILPSARLAASPAGAELFYPIEKNAPTHTVQLVGGPSSFWFRIT